MGASVVFLLPVILLLVSIQGALATVTPFLVPVSQVSTIKIFIHSHLILKGFHFDYDKPGQQLTIPITGTYSVTNKNGFQSDALLLSN